MPKEQILAQYQPHEVGGWLKHNEQLRVTLNQYRDQTYMALRVWYLNGDNEWAPGKNGISVPVPFAHVLGDAMDKALRALATHTG